MEVLIFYAILVIVIVHGEHISCKSLLNIITTDDCSEMIIRISQMEYLGIWQQSLDMTWMTRPNE